MRWEEEREGMAKQWKMDGKLGMMKTANKSEVGFHGVRPLLCLFATSDLQTLISLLPSCSTVEPISFYNLLMSLTKKEAFQLIPHFSQLYIISSSIFYHKNIRQETPMNMLIVYKLWKIIFFELTFRIKKTNKNLFTWDWPIKKLILLGGWY